MNAMGSRCLAPLLVVLALAGCDRAVEPYVPGEGVEAPDLTRIFPEGAERSAQNEAASQAETAAPERGAPPVAAGAAAVRGTITIAPDLAGRVPAGAILFLIARRGESGPPLAVQRVPDPKLPFEFSLGPEDRMIEQMPFAGPLTLSARLDADGNAMTRLPGDLQGVAQGTYEPGATGVAIVIDQVL
jgi:hypothetical protein